LKFLNCIQTPDDIIFGRELELFAGRHGNFETVLSTSSRGGAPGWTGLTGRIDRTMIERVAPDLAERHVYLCGPDGFMAAAKGLLEELGFDPARLHSESFAGPRSKSDEHEGGDATASANQDSSNAVGLQVEFARAGKRINANTKLPLLELAEAHGIELDYGCRTGNCGECKVRLLHGQADPGSDGALTAEERSAGWLLSCVATPRTDCVIDA
jgi:ferredoxin-NADP reductase